MTTTAETAQIIETAKNAGKTSGTGSSPYNTPLTMPIMAVLAPIIHAIMKRAQAVTDAKALNICGISLPPLN
jgi:hypothetical protein